MFQVARLNGGVSSSRFSRCSSGCPTSDEAAALIVSDARISFRIEHISEKVDQHEDHRQKQNAALDGRQIALLNGEQHVPPDTRPRKYRLRENAARQVVADIESQDRDDRQQRVAQRVAADDASL